MVANTNGLRVQVFCVQVFAEMREEMSETK